MSLSVLEAMSILRPIERDLARLDLPAYSLSDTGDERVLNLQKGLDTLASLLIGLSPVSPSKQVCAVSLCLLQSTCILTIAFNVRPAHPTDVLKLIHSIWDWMKDASLLAEEDVEKNRALFKIILEASLDRTRRRLKDKGRFVEPLMASVEVRRGFRTLFVARSTTNVDKHFTDRGSSSHSTSEELPQPGQ
jgi:hypothetical protein